MEQEQIPQINEITKQSGCKSGIYSIRNLINGKIYIGSAIDIERRWKYHKNRLRHNKHDNVYLQRSWHKYGENNFKFVIVRLVKFKTMLVMCEQIYLDLYESYKRENGYNILKFASSLLGHKLSEEAKDHLSKIMSGKNNPMFGKKHTDEAKRKISAYNKIRKFSAETRNKISKNHKDKKHSEEHKRKISLSEKGRKQSIEEREKNRQAHLGKIPWNKGLKGMSGKKKNHAESIVAINDIIK